MTFKNTTAFSFFRKYKPITTYEQRCLYKEDFNTEYKEYIALKEKVDPVSTKFTELQNKRLQFPEESTERQVSSGIFLGTKICKYFWGSLI